MPSDRRAQPADVFYSPREVSHVTPATGRLSEYEAVICGVQPDMAGFETGGWCPLSPTGRDVFEADSTRLRHPDWFDYRDPSGLWQRTYVSLQAAQERTLDDLANAARDNGAYQDVDYTWAESVLTRYYEAFACLEWGLFMAHARAMRHALSDTLTMTLTFAAVDRLRHQQAIALASLDFDELVLGYEEGRGMAAWVEDPAWQPARALIERLMLVDDWCETFLVTVLLIDPLLSKFVMSRFFRRVAPLNGDVITPTIVMTSERDRARNLAAGHALVEMVLRETDRRGNPVPAAANHTVIQEWIDEWTPFVAAAIDAFTPIYGLPLRTVDPATARHAVVTECRLLLSEFRLKLPVDT